MPMTINDADYTITLTDPGLAEVAELMQFIETSIYTKEEIEASRDLVSLLRKTVRTFTKNPNLQMVALVNATKLSFLAADVVEDILGIPFPDRVRECTASQQIEEVTK